MKVIEELYYGNIDPFEHGVQHKSEQKQLCGYICRLEDTLKAGLSDTQKGTLEKLQSNTAELHQLEELEMFTVGFRLGAKLMFEALEETNRQ